MESFNLLPIDVIKLITDVYYTPIISSLEEENKFYLNFEYPSHSIKLQMSRPDFRYGKGLRKIYLTEGIKTFINALNQNVESELCTNEPFNLKITLNPDYIYIIHEEVNMKIQISNTDLCRDQLRDAMIKYWNYVDMYDDEF